MIASVSGCARIALASALRALVAPLLFASTLFALTPSIASAQVRIAAPACADLDVAAVESFLAVEIADVAAEWRDVTSPVVLLGCASDRVRIEITDPVTDKSVARTVAWPTVDREHVLALAIAQLFLTSWLELLLTPEGGPGDDQARERAQEAVDEAQRETEEARAEPPAVTSPPPVTPAARATSVEGEIGIEGGARLRFEGETLGSGLAALRGVLVIEHALIIGARVGFEWGRAFRTRGAIELFGGTIGLVVGYRTPRIEGVFLDVTATLAPLLLVLEGRPTRMDVDAGTTRAIAAEAVLELAPSLAVGPVILAIPLAVGGVALAPNGEVTGEPPVITNGLVLSAQLRVSFAPSTLR